MPPFLRSFAFTVLSFPLTLALAYGMFGGNCARPSIMCYIPGAGCFALCSNAWHQFPQVFFVGLFLSALPAAAAGWTGTFARSHLSGQRVMERHFPTLMASVVGVFLSALTTSLVFGGLPGILIGIAAAASLALSFGLHAVVDFVGRGRVPGQGKR